MKNIESRSNTTGTSEIPQPNYALRRLGAGVLTVLAGVGLWKGGELVGDTLSDESIGCVEVQVQQGDNNIDPVLRGIEQLSEANSGFSPAYETETMREAQSLGVIQPGDIVNVCGTKDPVPLFGDSVTANIND